MLAYVGEFEPSHPLLKVEFCDKFIRINAANVHCHFSLAPFYKKYDDAQLAKIFKPDRGTFNLEDEPKVFRRANLLNGMLRRSIKIVPTQKLWRIIHMPCLLLRR